MLIPVHLMCKNHPEHKHSKKEQKYEKQEIVIYQ